jgi:hypothetical protein
VLCNIGLGTFEGTIQEANASIWDYIGLPSDFLGTMLIKAQDDVKKAATILEMETVDANAQFRMI